MKKANRKLRSPSGRLPALPPAGGRDAAPPEARNKTYILKAPNIHIYIYIYIYIHITPNKEITRGAAAPVPRAQRPRRSAGSGRTNNPTNNNNNNNDNNNNNNNDSTINNCNNY